MVDWLEIGAHFEVKYSTLLKRSIVTLSATLGIFVFITGSCFSAEMTGETTDGSNTPGVVTSTTPPPPPSSGDAVSIADEAQIRALLDSQADDWNRGDVEHFMNGYRKSNATLFVGAKGVRRGWQSILERYKTDYPDRKAMGHLSFSKLEIHVTSFNAAFVIGEFELVCADGTHKSGYFTLNLVKTGKRWEIVADHTTSKAQ